MSRRKRQKVNGDEEEELWTKFEEIPPEPHKVLVHAGYEIQYGKKVALQKDTNEKKRWKYMYRLSKSLIAAVRGGNTEFVRKVIERKCDVLRISEHKPQTNYSDARKVLCEMNGTAPPIQPNFGFRDLYWGPNMDEIERTNLLKEAIKGNQLDMVRELIRLNFDINAPIYNSRNPLLIAIRSGHYGIIDLLLEQTHIILTHPETTRYARSSSRQRCEATALSEATSHGMLDVVQKLIKRGALSASSTSRPDDPYPLNQSRAEKLVNLSIKEAILEAHRNSNPYRPNRSMQSYADILETLLSKTGVQDKNVITVYITDQIRRGEWRDISLGSMYGYRYDFGDDKDFEPKTGTPNARAVAVARGLRPGYPFFGEDTANSEKQIMEEKRKQWKELLAICRERLVAAGPDWMKAVDEAKAAWEAAGSYWEQREAWEEVRQARFRTQMLFWCNLFASPWSKERHTHYPLKTRLVVKEVLHTGSLLDRMCGQAGALKEMWDREVLPFAIE